MSCSCENSTCFCGTPCPCSKHCFRCVKSKNFRCTLCKEPFLNEDAKPVGKVCICFTAHSNVGNQLKKESSLPSALSTPSLIGFQPVCLNPTLIPGELSNKDVEHHLNNSNSDSKSLQEALQNQANGTTEHLLSYASVLKCRAEPSNPKVSTCHSDSILSNSQSDTEETLHQVSTENKTLPSKPKPNCMLNSKLSFLDGVDSETSASYRCKTCHKPLYLKDIPMQGFEANSVCNCFLIRSKELIKVPHEPDTTEASSLPPSEIVPRTSVTSVNNGMNSNTPVPELMGNSNPTAHINVPGNIVPVPVVMIWRPMILISNVPPKNNAPSYSSVLGNASNTTHESTRNNLKDESYSASTQTDEKAKPQNVFYPELIDSNQKVFDSQCSFNSSTGKTLQTNFQAPARMSSECSGACAHVMPRMTPPSSQASIKTLELCDFKENVCDSCYPLLESKKRVASEVPLPGLQTFETKANNDSAAALNNTCNEGLNDPLISHSQINISGSHLKFFKEDTENHTELVDFETLKKNIQYAKAAKDKYINYLSTVATKYSRHTQM